MVQILISFKAGKCTFINKKKIDTKSYTFEDICTKLSCTVDSNWESLTCLHDINIR